MIAGLFAALSLSACATDGDLVDELAGAESDSDAVAGKADAVDLADYTYFEIAPDYRKCVAPLCGGAWVNRVNHATTKCANGQYAAKCYVAEVDWAALGLNADRTAVAQDAYYQGKLLVKGVVGSKTYASFGKLGRFIPEEAWVAETDGPADGPFMRLTDAGIRCITFPCLTFREDKLNSVVSAMIGGVDFTDSGASEDQISKAFTEMAQPGGILATGYRTTVTGPAAKAKARTVTKFWRRLQQDAVGACYVGGCSSQVCSDQPGVITTCEFRPEYACYQGATCERQADGACGWTQTDTLLQCLANPPTP